MPPRSIGPRSTKSSAKKLTLSTKTWSVKQGNFLCHFTGGPLNDQYIEMEDKSYFHIMDCKVNGKLAPCYYRLARDNHERGRVDRTNDVVKKSKPDLEFEFHHYCKETEVSVKVYRESERIRRQQQGV